MNDQNTTIAHHFAITRSTLDIMASLSEEALQQLHSGTLGNAANTALEQLAELEAAVNRRATGSVEPSTEVPVSDSVCRKVCEDISKQRIQLAKAKSVLDLMYESSETCFDNFDETAGVAADIVGRVNNRLDEIETILSREARS